MDKIYSTNIETLKKASDKALILMGGLYNLPYFNKENLEKNIGGFKFSLSDSELSNNQFARYIPSLNSICINEELLKSELIDEDLTSILLLHELIHMASFNKEKNMVGFGHEAVPVTYNQGCTEYLTLKLFYKDKIEEGINNDMFYPQSVRIIKNVVDALGEDKIFDGFFEADLKKNVDGFSPKVLDKWIDYVMEMDQSLEEKMSKESMMEAGSTLEEVASARS